MEVNQGKVTNSEFHNSIFAIKNTTVSQNVYVIEQLTFSQEGTVDIVASEHPCDNDQRSLMVASMLNQDQFEVV